MIGPKTLRARLAKVFANAGGADSILLVNTGFQDPNFTYITDFRGGLYEGNLLLLRRNKAVLATYTLEYEMARRQAPKGMDVVRIEGRKSIDALAKKVKGTVIGMNCSFVPYRTYMRISKRMKPKRIVDVSDAFAKAREIKDYEEIRRISKASSITKKAIAITISKLKAGMTEKEAAAVYENAIMLLGADGTSFGSIVCFGKNAALPHHVPDGTRLKYGDFVLIDVGSKVGNYCSDVTRTILFGKDRKRIKDYAAKSRVLEVVEEAQKAAISGIREGISGSSIHAIASGYIDRAYGGRYKGTFIHSLGHSVGIETHDATAGGGFLSPGSKLILRKGMISSVEPGIYIPGFGGARREDDILVTKDGCRIL